MARIWRRSRRSRGGNLTFEIAAERRHDRRARSRCLRPYRARAPPARRAALRSAVLVALEGMSPSRKGHAARDVEAPGRDRALEPAIVHHSRYRRRPARRDAAHDVLRSAMPARAWIDDDTYLDMAQPGLDSASITRLARGAIGPSRSGSPRAGPPPRFESVPANSSRATPTGGRRQSCLHAICNVASSAAGGNRTDMTTDHDVLQITTANKVRLLTLNRPDRRNACPRRCPRRCAARSSRPE